MAAALLMGTTLMLTSCAEGNNGDMPPESTTGDTQITGPEDDMTDTMDAGAATTAGGTTAGTTTTGTTAGGATGATTAGTTTTGSTTGTTDGTTTTGTTAGGTTTGR